jgi:hypothetical protein
MQTGLSQRALSAQPSPTLALTARAQELRRQGVDVLSFTAGEPDFDTPDFAKTGALEAIHAGYTKYTPTPGILPLREAIAEKFERENNLRYAPDQIVVSCGAKHSLFGAFMALLDPGDEVIVPTPCWVSYPEQVRLMGATPVLVSADETTDFLPDYDALRRAITPRTKAIVLNTPCNPTGAVYGRKHAQGDCLPRAHARPVDCRRRDLRASGVRWAHAREHRRAGQGGVPAHDYRQRRLQEFRDDGLADWVSGRADGGRPRGQPSCKTR